MAEVSTFLWFKDKVEEAAGFYVSLLPNSQIRAVTHLPGGVGVSLVEFALQGRSFTAMQAAHGAEPFNNAISIMVVCDDQAVIDHLWAALTDGGSEIVCGWLKDRYGVAWQIVPKRFIEMARDKDPAKAGRALAAMNQMVKFDIAALERAFNGQSAAS
jgi:predicted 3-demethylubiquinone-9 3-methyltransferase (glyoxalase superfamily)